MLKRCNQCQRILPDTEFYKSSSARDGLQYMCKECSSVRRKEYHAANREKYNAKSKEWIEANRDKIRNYQLSKYGITQKEYDSLRENQNYSCAICFRNEKDVPRSNYEGSFATALHVDHCHTTGKVRGLLCFNCNALLGKVRDDPVILAEAIKYLEGKECK